MAGDLSEQSLERAVGERPVRYFEVIGSTNTEALAWAAEGAPRGAVVVAEQQTQGRGRWGRTWVSQPERALMFSVVVGSFPLERIGLVTIALGVATAEAVAALCGVEAHVKWPNDVTVGGRKLAGVLVESRVVDGAVEAAVAGVGVNVGYARDEFPPEIAERATSLRIESDGPVPPRPELLGAIVERFEALVDGPDIVARAEGRSDVLGRVVVVRFADGSRVEGRALRLTREGGLEIESADGRRVLDGGEIERIRAAGP